MQIVGYTYFTGVMGTFAIVEVDMSNGTKKCFIGECKGFGPREDLEYIVDYGAPFPKEIGMNVVDLEGSTSIPEECND